MFTIATQIDAIVILEYITAVVAQREATAPAAPVAPAQGRRRVPTATTLEQKIAGREAAIARDYALYVAGGQNADSHRKDIEWNLPGLLAMYKERADKRLIATA